jgi:type III secretory pathway component EscT
MAGFVHMRRALRSAASAMSKQFNQQSTRSQQRKVFNMPERILFAISVALALLAASFSLGIIRQGAQNVNELFHGVPADE